MTRTSLLLLSPLLLALAACSAPRDPDAAAGTTPPADAPADPSPTTPPADDEQTCNAEAARSAIGKTASEEVIEQARKDAGAATARTLAPGQVVTLEFRGDRLNLDVDGDNVVTGVRCG